MRSAIVPAFGLMLTAATTAHAADWCGYTARANAVIECGYSTATSCEATVGKGGMCFVDPDYALNVKHAAPATMMPAPSLKHAG